MNVKMNLRWLVSGYLLAGLTLLSFGQNQNLQDSVDAVMDRYLQSSGGFSVAVVEPNGAITTGGNGFASIGIPVSDTLLFGCSDLSQHFMAVLTLKLAENGTLNLSDQIGAGVVAGPPTVVPTSTTIEQLLNHTSGINNFASHPNYTNPSLSLLFNDLAFDYATVNYAPIMGAFVAAQGNASAPGTFQYSNTNYLILGEKLEMITNDSLQGLLETYVFGPAGLTEIQFYNGQDLDATSAFYFNLSGILPEALSDQTSVITSTGASAGIFSRPGTLLQYMRALLDGQILNAASLTQLIDFDPIAGRLSKGYGLGTESFELVVDGSTDTYIGHLGSVNYKTLLAYQTEDSIGVAIMNNLFDTNDTLVIELAQELLTQVKLNRPVSIEKEQFSEVGLKLFPNPVQDRVTLDFELEQVGVVQIQLLSLKGQSVFQSDLGQMSPGKHRHQIVLPNLPEGMYLLELKTATQREVRKIQLHP